MKANRKFIEKEAGVSAVIGVILMVAITVAIASTVYVYASGLISATEVTPIIAFEKGSDYLMIIKCEPNDISWEDITYNNTGNTTAAIFPTGDIKAGQFIQNLTGRVILTYRDVAVLGQWKF